MQLTRLGEHHLAARRYFPTGSRPRNSFLADPPLIVPIEDLITPGSEWEHTEVLIKKLLQSYRRTLGHEHHPIEEFRYAHAARKVVGVGASARGATCCCCSAATTATRSSSS